MPIQILMPALSPTMEEGVLSRWLVKEGDSVSSGDVIAEIETDKATMEFEAVDEGVVGRILVEEGAEGVKVNTPIAVLLEEGEDQADIDGASAKGETPEAKPAEEPKKPEEAKKSARIEGAAEAKPTRSGDRIFASPLARRMASQKGLDLAAISGSGPNGRIVKADVEAARPAAADGGEAKAGQAKGDVEAKAPVAPATTADGVLRLYEGVEFEEIKLDGMRRTVAARLTEAKQTVPHFYLRRSIEIDELLRFRAELNDALESRGAKLSVNDFIIKACALALTEVPECNSVWASDRILRFRTADVAVAVAVESGLFTPIIRDAAQKPLSVISTEMNDLAARAKERKLSPKEYQGGSFAISNLGMYGIENFDAVINPPHGSILAIGAGLRRPVASSDDQIRLATVMSCTLSVDHRVIDGALGARFLEAVTRHLENPIAMLA